MPRAAGSKHYNVTLPRWGVLFLEAQRLRLGGDMTPSNLIRSFVLDYLTATCFGDDKARVTAALAHYGVTRGRQTPSVVASDRLLEELAMVYLQGAGIQLPDDVVCLGVLPRSIKPPVQSSQSVAVDKLVDRLKEADSLEDLDMFAPEESDDPEPQSWADVEKAGGLEPEPEESDDPEDWF